MSDMTIQPMGPEAIQRRISEIQARTGFTPAPTPAFSKALDKAGYQPSPLVGNIGDGSLEPLNPFGSGASVGPMAEKFRPMAEKIAQEEGVDPALFDSLVQTESAYDPSARSRAGAMGLTQLMPGTASGLGVRNPFDPEQNLRGGAKYLNQMLLKFKDPRLALAAYNAGPGAVEQAGGVPNYSETKAYVNKIMAMTEAKRTP